MALMKTITTEELDEKLRLHKLWLNRAAEGKKADLSFVDLSSANLSSADLRNANLSFANLSFADLSSANLHNTILSSANLSFSNLSFVDLSSANLSSADLRNANLSFANLHNTTLSFANLHNANLRSSDLHYANLSCAQGLKSNIDFLAENFEKTEEGYIAYKTFGYMYDPPSKWNIAKGSIFSENVNFNRANVCGCGINVAPLDWVKQNCSGTIWKCLIRWEWVVGICCPYNSDGKIRCERIELIEPVSI